MIPYVTTNRSDAKRHLGWPLLLLLAVAAQLAAAEKPRPPVDYGGDIRPILAARCYKCHGPDAEKREAELRLDTRYGALADRNGSRAIVPGNVAASALYQRITSDDDDFRMPPPKTERNLAPREVELLRRWIEQGAPWSEHWAFAKAARPTLPAVKKRGWPRNPVDAFLLARLEENGIVSSSEADRATLIRRVTLDLTGLPPALDDVESFLADQSPDAYERLVDRLLASPAFGERWGRHWLDEAGYVDVLGGDNDAGTIKLRQNKWLYRDYVIRSLNADKSFDRFLLEQLAGDEWVDWRSADTFTTEIRESLTATGFLRVAADDTDENELNVPGTRHGVLQRTGETVASNLLALTFNCAKCHDHKYEPITQRDYYQWLAIFQPAFNPERWLQPAQRELPDISPKEKRRIESYNAQLDRKIGELKEQIAKLLRPHEERLRAGRSATMPIKAGEARAALNDPEKAKVAQFERCITDLNTVRKSWGHLQVVYDAGPPTPIFLLRRGNHETRGSEVLPGFPSVLDAAGSSLPLRMGKLSGTTSGRRLALALWLTDLKSPAGALVLRVRANRIWQRLFGRGIVATSDNLGLTGAAPTHPELLEWLAAEQADQGQRLKPLLKLMLAAAVYRQVSSNTVAAGNRQPDSVDPEVRLLWRMPLRRLEAEAIRDSLLVVSGQLDRTFGGPSVPVEHRPDGTFAVADNRMSTGNPFRRSVYLLARRNYHPTLLEVFDQPNLMTNCPQRSSSAVVLQSLTMLNDRFVLDCAERLAKRVAGMTGSFRPQCEIDTAFRLVLARRPKPAEMDWCSNLVAQHTTHYEHEKLPPDQAAHKALSHFCHVLLNTSEFLYLP